MITLHGLGRQLVLQWKLMWVTDVWLSRLDIILSSVNFTRTISLEGIFDGDKVLSSFWGANKVYVKYWLQLWWVARRRSRQWHHIRLRVSWAADRSISTGRLDHTKPHYVLLDHFFRWWLGGNSRHDEPRGLSVGETPIWDHSGRSISGFTLLDRLWTILQLTSQSKQPNGRSLQPIQCDRNYFGWLCCCLPG